MKKLLLIAFIISFAFVLKAQDKSAKNYDEAFNLIAAWLETQKDFDRLPGISAIVVEDQKILWEGAFGYANLEKKVESKPNTIYSICSISKLFTSVAIMKLYDEGKLRLDDKIEDLLPQYKLQQAFPESGPITIRTLMTHSSGLPREANFPYWTNPDFQFPSKEQVDKGLEKQKTLYPASTYFQYSNLALTLLGEIVEEVSGKPYSDYIKENILTPLQLNDTRTFMPENLYGTKLSIGYSALNRNGAREKVTFFDANGIKPAAGFSSTVEDLAKFAMWQFRLRDTNKVEILKPSTLKYMQQVHWTNPNWNITWGLGFSVVKGYNGNTWVGHGGSCPGYRTVLKLDLNTKRAYSVMVNAGGSKPANYVKGMDQILSKVETVDSLSKNNQVNFNDYTGYYSLQTWWSEIYFTKWNGKLAALVLPTENPGDALKFYKHIEGDTFRRIRDNDELGEELVFERDENGNVFRYKTHNNYNSKIK
ncbi:MAG: hypothetical protein CR986_04980 [Ignavibacteriae bacterium]|nr:MAG: hypothetical protein CR986_04980 [Ignavibacteriota bacterium]